MALQLFYSLKGEFWFPAEFLLAISEKCKELGATGVFMGEIGSDFDPVMSFANRGSKLPGIVVFVTIPSAEVISDIQECMNPAHNEFDCADLYEETRNKIRFFKHNFNVGWNKADWEEVNLESIFKKE
jgi:hypothetical protein